MGGISFYTLLSKIPTIKFLFFYFSVKRLQKTNKQIETERTNSYDEAQDPNNNRQTIRDNSSQSTLMLVFRIPTFQYEFEVVCRWCGLFIF
ncbi:hypothetical protein CVS40_5058 [Lucilia cuprina]|nr:hypothetical protein CVS40_5058 [Lucilia cuprina]